METHSVSALHGTQNKRALHICSSQWNVVILLGFCFLPCHCLFIDRGKVKAGATSPVVCSNGEICQANVNVNFSTVLHSVGDRFVSFTVDTMRIRWGHDERGHSWRVNMRDDDKNAVFVDWEDPTMIAMARALSPAYLRIGGTSADNVTYEMDSAGYGIDSRYGDDVAINRQHYVPSARGSSTADLVPHSTLTPKIWMEPNSFAMKVGWDVIFALNVFDGWEAGNRTWDGGRAVSLMRHTKTMGYPVVGWELGNEPNLERKDISAFELATAFQSLASKVREVYGSSGKGAWSSPWIIGPDVTKIGAVDGGYMGDLLENLRSSCDIDVVTWHHYYVSGEDKDKPVTFLGVDALKTYHRYEKYAEKAKQTFDSYAESCGGDEVPQLWIGETSGVGGATMDANEILGKAVEILWYADKLGVSAKQDYKAVLRQEWFDESGASGPSMNTFWVALLWKRLMGQHVLQVDRGSGDPDTFRMYAHKNDKGFVTLVVVNVVDVPVDVSVTLEGTAPDVEHEEYHLTAQNGDINGVGLLVNGVSLPSTFQQMASFLKDGEVPPLGPVLSSATTVHVEALSVVFVQFSP